MKEFLYAYLTAAISVLLTFGSIFIVLPKSNGSILSLVYVFMVFIFPYFFIPGGIFVVILNTIIDRLEMKSTVRLARQVVISLILAILVCGIIILLIASEGHRSIRHYDAWFLLVLAVSIVLGVVNYFFFRRKFRRDMAEEA